MKAPPTAIREKEMMKTHGKPAGEVLDLSQSLFKQPS